jgi:hypothetical protein
MTRLCTLFTGLTIASALVLSGAPALAQAPATPKVEKPAATLPPAQEILDRHVKAAGGREAFEGIDSTHVRGSIAIPANGMSGSFEAFAARPNKTFMKMSLAGIGDTTEGFDGTVAWAMSPMTGPMVVTGEELEQKKFDADFNAMLNVASRYESRGVRSTSSNSPARAAASTPSTTTSKPASRQAASSSGRTRWARSR